MNGVVLFKNTKMNKYLIEYENAHWCGGTLHVVVNANSAEEAEDKAMDHMESEQRELFFDEYEDSNGEFDESAVVINSIEILDEDNDYWPFYNDPSQSEFYPEIE